jgi:tetratricopeptide (TPR) repeat protein
MWFRRAVRIARLDREKDAEIDFAVAHLGWGNLESDLGRFAAAEHHATKAFRAAMRRGRRSLAASAYHDLMTIAIHTERYQEAANLAVNAVTFYKSDHPRLAALAHDVAYLWGKLGYFSSAAPLYEAVLPFISLQVERVVVLANLARAAGACRDRLRYERAFQTIDKLTQDGAACPASAFYHLAQGCRSFEEWERAERYCGLALATATERGNALIVAQAERLSYELSEPRVHPGDQDVVPPEGGEVDGMREALIRKLRKQAPGGAPKAVPPEKYPIER